MHQRQFRAARLAFEIGDRRLADGIPLSKLFAYEKSLFRRGKGDDVAVRLTPTGGGGWWNVLITPPTISSAGWRSPSSIVMHCAPRLSRLGSLRIPEESERDRGRLPAGITRRICEYVESHLDEKLRLDHLAAMAGLSIHHFARAFRQSVGVPPHSYLLQQRLKHVERMLRDTELPLSEIALSAGFSDQSHLSRHFRRFAGVAPSAARWKLR